MNTTADSAQAYYPPPESRGGWRRLDDPAQMRALAGLDVEALARRLASTSTPVPSRSQARRTASCSMMCAVGGLPRR